MKKALAVVGNLLAWFSFGVGLLSPLTPSEGLPEIGMLLSFVMFPLFLLLHAWRTYERRFSKAAVALQAAVMLGAAIWLLIVQSGGTANAS